MFSITVRRWRAGVGYGTSDCETAWSKVWVCTDGGNTWLEEVKEDCAGEVSITGKRRRAKVLM